jgi:hypothetical protein
MTGQLRLHVLALLLLLAAVWLPGAGASAGLAVRRVLRLAGLEPDLHGAGATGRFRDQIRASRFASLMVICLPLTAIRPLAARS